MLYGLLRKTSKYLSDRSRSFVCKPLPYRLGLFVALVSAVWFGCVSDGVFREENKATQLEAFLICSKI